MNKKGLTFMSFAISVICLGVVLIILWPKIEKIIDDSHENIFTNKVKDMIKSVGKTYVSDQSREYSNVLTGTKHLKDVSDKYQYIINMNGDGHVSSIKVTDGKFRVEGENILGINVDDIGNTYRIIHATNEFKLNSNGEFTGD